jgi:hypothetical protein
MINPILVTLAVEDVLSEFVLREIIRQSQRPYMVVNCLCRGGYGYLKKNIRHFNEAAQGIPFLVLTDLDRAECPPTLIKKMVALSNASQLVVSYCSQRSGSVAVGAS